jgi:hypothetical protein
MDYWCRYCGQPGDGPHMPKCEENERFRPKIVVILSSPLGFPGATIKFEEAEFPSSLAGCTSYVGHPATRAKNFPISGNFVPTSYEKT